MSDGCGPFYNVEALTMNTIPEYDNNYSEPIMLTPIEKYDNSVARYERLSDLKLRNHDTIVLGGHGAAIKVRYDSLSCEYIRGDENRYMVKLDRGTHRIRQIVLFSRGGYVTLDALEWIAQQNITLYLMEYNGELIQVMTPIQHRNAKLTYLQFQSMQSEVGLSISKELIQRKTLSQIDTIDKFPELNNRDDTIRTLENGLHMLHSFTSIDQLRLHEGRMATAYFNTFTDIPIKWDRKYSTAIPEHWKLITPRISPISINGNARNAICPYHAVLNFSLALLKAQVLQAINIAGLSPEVGFLHTYVDGKLSLVFDLMEPFRAQVDSIILSLFHSKVFHKGDFIQAYSGEATMNPGLKKFVAATCRVDYIQIDRVCRWLRDILLNG
jgi:CRISPR-associated protein Cas1